MENDRPPVVGVVGRQSGEGRFEVVDNADQETLEKIVISATDPGATVYTDEWSGYNHLPELGRNHSTVCHMPGQREWARDDDGDGVREVHVNTLEGFWSLLRSWLRPHRGISQERLPLYLGFFEFVHNVRRRGKALLGALVGLLLKPSPRNTG